MLENDSNDPFLALLTLNHDDFDQPVRLVNNTVNIDSRGETYLAFPFKFVLSTDDGESDQYVKIEMDNSSLLLMEKLRSITSPVTVTIEMVLASTPGTVEVGLGELKLRNIAYNAQSISGTLSLDDFLNTDLTSESYSPTSYPGIFS